MRIRKVGPGEAAPAVELARKLDLDYPGIEADELWIAREGAEIIGLVALKKHPDCLELCALGVDPARRGRGTAKALVEALIAAAPGPVHLATVIPGFFETCGFVQTADIPRAFVEKRKTAWCEGCDKSRCTVMRREGS
jgi:N-acetylglutamate synthase-like GNAT family acetyltransferase